MSTPLATAPASINRTTSLTPPRQLPSHYTTIEADAAERHRWDDLDLQHRIASHTQPNSVEQELLLEARRKVGGKIDSEYGICWAKLKVARSYGKTLSIAICGEYPRREDLARCGFLTFSCRDRLLCPLCCYRFLGKPLADEFGNAIPAGYQVFYIVISLNANPDESCRLKFRDYHRADREGIRCNKLATPCDPEHYGIPFQTEGDIEQARLVWELFSKVIHDLTGTGKHQRFLGAVGGPELSVQFQPLRALPHCNFVIWTSSFTEDDARELRRLLRLKMRNCRPLKLRLFPSVACLRMRTRDDVRAVLSYSLKPIDLSGQYTQAAERANYDPARMVSLNNDVKLFLRNLPLAFQQLPRITRHGCCHPNARSYIGHTTIYRAARRQREAERRRALRGNGSRAQGDSKQSTARAKHKPRRSKWSRFFHWYRAVMPGPPLAPPGAPRKTPR